MIFPSLLTLFYIFLYKVMPFKAGNEVKGKSKSILGKHGRVETVNTSGKSAEHRVIWSDGTTESIIHGHFSQLMEVPSIQDHFYPQMMLIYLPPYPWWVLKGPWRWMKVIVMNPSRTLMILMLTRCLAIVRWKMSCTQKMVLPLILLWLIVNNNHCKLFNCVTCFSFSFVHL